MRTALKVILLAVRNIFSQATFFAPLTNSLILSKGTGNPTFTRATVASVFDNEGVLRSAVPNEARFSGARRVENLIASSSVSLGKSLAFTVTLLRAGTVIYSQGAGTSTVTFSGTSGATGTLACNASARTSVTKTVSAGTFIITNAATANVVDLMLEDTTGQSVQQASGYQDSFGLAASSDLVFGVVGPNTLNIVTTRSAGTNAWLADDGQTSTALTCSLTLPNSKQAISLANPGAQLTQFLCSSNQLTGSIPSLSANTALVDFRCDSNQLTGSIPNLSANTALTLVYCNSNQLTGSIPSLSANTALTLFRCDSNQLTGSIPNLSANTALTLFRCDSNQLTGSIPNLSANTALTLVYCNSNQLTGSIPSLSANTALTEFRCETNQLTGSIPNLSANTALTLFRCYTNQLTGSIPSLSANTALTEFRCQNNQLSGWTGGTVSNTLGYFNAQTNNLTQAAVDAILAAFVAAGRAAGTRVLSLDGTGNATPSAAGLADKATLVTRGWTVGTN